tara:strand:+ start:273 stop:443 length:171 start_codon:yes stop_codon:yes gene_type:complete
MAQENEFKPAPDEILYDNIIHIEKIQYFSKRTGFAILESKNKSQRAAISPQGEYRA